MQQQFPLPVVLECLFLDHSGIQDFIPICDPKAQFRRQTFHEPNLIRIEVGPYHENPAF